MSKTAGPDQDAMIVACGRYLPAPAVYYNNMYRLDFGTLAWSLVAPAGTPPTPVAEYAGEACDCRFIVSHGYAVSAGGGINQTHVYNILSNAWESPTFVGTPPPAEFGYDAAWDPVNRALFIFSGYNGVPRNRLYLLMGL
jgi:hypothetical protein